MKYVGFLVVLTLTIALGVAVSTPFGSIPPLAPLLDPNHGFWQNSISEDKLAEDELELNNLGSEVKVITMKILFLTFLHLVKQTYIELRDTLRQSIDFGRWNSRRWLRQVESQKLWGLSLSI